MGSAGAAVVFDSWGGEARALDVRNSGAPPQSAASSVPYGTNGSRSASASFNAQQGGAVDDVTSFSGSAVADGACTTAQVIGNPTVYVCSPSPGHSSLGIKFGVTDEPVEITLAWQYSGTAGGSCPPAGCASTSSLELTALHVGGTSTRLHREESTTGSGSLDGHKVTLVPGSYQLSFFLSATVTTYSSLTSPASLAANGSASFSATFGPLPQPVVFIPGVAGSVLVDRLANDEELWVGLNPLRWLQLSLYPSTQPSQYDVRPREPLRAVANDQIYGPFLDRLEAEGYLPYELEDGMGKVVSERLTSAGCDLTQDDGDTKPTLFAFPYDWRLSNSANALNLRDYIGCVQQFHPNAKIDVVAHSMGSLLARRYTLAYADHGIDKLITIGAPYLGAPKLLYVLETGDFLGHLPGIFKLIIGSMTGPHQLLPSRDYFDLVFDLAEHDVVSELDRDLNNDGVLEALDFDQMVAVVDDAYGREGFLPGTKAEQFHQGGQDDWTSDTTGIAFHHIVGDQSGPETVGGVIATWTTNCNVIGLNCKLVPIFKLHRVRGDGTVPLVSSRRTGPTINLNAPGAQIQVFSSPAANLDKSVEHNGLMSHVPVQNQVLAWLAADSPAPQQGTQFQAAQPTAATLPATLPATDQITLSGVTARLVSDDLGNDTGVVGGVMQGRVPGVSTYQLGENVWLASIPDGASETYTLLFETTDEPIGIEILVGDADAPSRAIRYADLVFASGTPARLIVSPLGVQLLEVDTTRDGSFATVVTPQVDVVGAAALDVRGPEVTVTPRTASAPGLTSISLSAQDIGSGVTGLHVSLNGTDFAPYTGPLELDSSVTPFLYVLAQDALMNRSARAIDLTLVPEPAFGVMLLSALGTLGWLRATARRSSR